jgi:hypothetical protein
VLKKPEVTAQFRSTTWLPMPISATWSWTTMDPLHEMVTRHNPRKLRPVLVFLDGSGKEVARLTGGLKTTEDALLLDRYVAEKHYLKGGDFAAFRKAQKG